MKRLFKTLVALPLMFSCATGYVTVTNKDGSTIRVAHNSILRRGCYEIAAKYGNVEVQFRAHDRAASGEITTLGAVLGAGIAGVAGAAAGALSGPLSNLNSKESDAACNWVISNEQKLAQAQEAHSPLAVPDGDAWLFDDELAKKSQPADKAEFPHTITPLDSTGSNL